MKKEELKNLIDMEKDILSHPSDDLVYLDKIFKSDIFSRAEIEDINSALNILLHNDNLSETKKAEFLNESWKINYKFKVPSPAEFLTEKWIGPQAKDLYPHARRTFIDYFNPFVNKNKLILYCCTGWGKTTILDIIKAYRAVKTVALRNFKQFLKLSEATRITDVSVSFTKSTCYDLIIKPLVTILDTSPMFERVKFERDMNNPEYTSSGKILFCNTNKGNSMIRISDVYFDVACDPMDLIGRNIISFSATELTFLSEKMPEEKVMKLLEEGITRVYNRFGYNNPNTTIVIDSSPNSLENKVDQWIGQHKDDKDVYYVNHKKWEAQPWIFPIWEKDNSKVFPMFVGSASKPPQVIKEEERKNYDVTDIIDFPIDIRDLAEENASKILRDFGATPTASSDQKLIQNTDTIDRIFVPNLRNFYSYIYTSAMDNPEGLLWEVLKKEFFIYTGRGNLYQFYRNPLAERFISVDLAKKHDMACMACSHLESNIKGEKIYVVDFALAVMARKGDEINMDAFKFAIADIVKYGGMKVSHASYDGFQSDTTIQYLNRIGVDTERLSVDLNMEYYLSMVAYMQQNRFKIGKNLIFKNNLKSLIRTTTRDGKGDKPKIDHVKGEWVDLENLDWEQSKMGYYGKDLSDAICASVGLCDLYGKLTADYLYSMDEEKEMYANEHLVEAAENSIMEQFGLILQQ